MAEQKPHFEIPADRVRTGPIRVRGRSRPVVRPSYSAHGDYLRERAASVRAYAEETEDASAAESLFLQVRTPEILPVSGEKQRLKSAGFKVVALSSVDPSSATVQIAKRDLEALERKVERYATTPANVGKSYMAIIEDFGPVPAEQKLATGLLLAPDDPVDCLLTFYSTLTEAERAAVLFAVRSYLARTGGELGEQRRFSNGVTVLEARLRPSEARAAGAAFTTLKEIVPNRVVFVPDSWRIGRLPPGISVDPPKLSTTVAVIDTGVNGACPTMTGTVAATLPQLPPGAIAPQYDHGTFVGSRIVYGDNLEQQLRSGVLKPECRLIDVPVLGVDDRGNLVNATEAHLASALDDVLQRLPTNARVVNISLGTGTPVVDGHVSLLGQLVDKHARERDLLVVTTAGNVRDPRLLSRFPNSLLSPQCRIDSPGDAVLAMTVGSMAKYEDEGALSRVQEVSPFSRRGPGPFGGFKPDVVAHGGNCFGDGTTNARIATHGLVPDGQAWACDYGTSFAAPLVSAMAATLFDHYPGATAVLIRALLLHFTDTVLAPELNGIPPVHIVGLGEPNVEAARWSRNHAATFIHVGELSQAQFTYLPFHVPACLSEGGSGRLAVKVTVVIDPPVDPDNQPEYCRCRVTLALRKPTDVGHSPVSLSDKMLDTDKWCPVSQCFRQFRRSYGTGEWELQLRLWTRNAPTGFRQRFAAVIEVIDQTGTLPVREDVEREVGVLYRPINVRTAA